MADQLRATSCRRRCSPRTPPGGVIHASSFSKTVSPGVIAGYLAGPAPEIATLAKRGSPSTYISPNMLAESIVLELCRSGRACGRTSSS